MISSENFHKALRDLTILTGKGLTIWGNKPTPDKYEYAIDVYYEQLCQHDERDIISALKDKDMIKEVCAGYSLNINIMEKYIQIHKYRRGGKKKKSSEGIGDFKYEPPADCAAKLKSHGIDVSKIASEKVI